MLWSILYILVCKLDCCREVSGARSSWRWKWKMVTRKSFSVRCTATSGGPTPGKVQTRRTGGRRGGGEEEVGEEMRGGEAAGEEEEGEAGLHLLATEALHHRGMESMERSKVVVSGGSAGEVMTAKVGVEGGEAMREEGMRGEEGTTMPGTTITGEMRDGEEEAGGTSGTTEEATEVGELEDPSGTSKVVNNSSSSKMVLARVLIRRRSRRLCHLVVRRTRVGGRVTPTIARVEEAGSSSSKQNRGVLVSLMALVGLLPLRIGRTRPGSRPTMT